jgi:hypothetical protein
MTPEEAVQIAELLRGLLPQTTLEKKIPKKRKTTKKVVKKSIKKTTKKRGRPTKNTSVNTTLDNDDSNTIIKVQPRKKITQIKEKWDQGKGLASRIESVKLGPRPNLFLKSAEAKQCKEDSKIDKLLWKGRTPSERNRPNNLISIACQICQQVHEVSSSLVYRDPDKGLCYTCNNCLRRG